MVDKRSAGWEKVVMQALDRQRQERGVQRRGVRVHDVRIGLGSALEVSKAPGQNH